MFDIFVKSNQWRDERAASQQFLCGNIRFKFQHHDWLRSMNPFQEFASRRAVVISLRFESLGGVDVERKYKVFQ